MQFARLVPGFGCQAPKEQLVRSHLCKILTQTYEHFSSLFQFWLPLDRLKRAAY